jgi:hypothetical protein
MKPIQTERSQLLASYRQENIVSIPMLCAAIGLVILLIALLNFSGLGLVAMLSLAALFTVGLIQSVRTLRMDDERLIHSLASRGLAMYLWLSLTVLGIGIETEMNVTMLLCIVAFAAHADYSRTALAQRLI